MRNLCEKCVFFLIQNGNFCNNPITGFINNIDSGLGQHRKIKSTYKQQASNNPVTTNKNERM